MTSPSRSLPDRIQGLDALRALAAIAILFAHGGYFLFALLPIYDLYAFSGWLGTELFFALAGYLLTRQLIASPPRDIGDVTRWWAWRAWRILPLFWGALALHVLLATTGGAMPGIEVAIFIPLAQNLAWTHPATFGEAWNLPVLVLFFLAAPVIVALLRMRHDDVRRMQQTLVILIVFAIIARTAWVVWLDPLWDADVRKIVLSRLDACLYGALAACVVARAASLRIASTTSTHPLRWPIAAAAIWAAAALGFALLPRDTSNIARIGLFVLSGAAGACTVAAFLAYRRTARPLAALARWSWPLYLLNMPVLIAMAQLGFGQTADATSSLLRFTVWLIVSIALAALVHRVIEQPLLRARARRLARPAAANDAPSATPASR